MVSVTKHYGEDGLVLDKSLAFASSGKDISDLLREMESNAGLRVSNLVTTGEIVRVSVGAVANQRPDKGQEKSGWYSVNYYGDAIFASYGNWRQGIEFKFSSINPNEMSAREREDLKRRMEESIERSKQQRAERYDEVSQDCKKRFESAIEVIDHPYLDKKQIKSYGLKAIRDSLVVPVHCIEKGLRSLQYINNEKRFVSASEVKGNIYHLGFDLSDIANQKKIIVCEGAATAHSIFEATNLPTICVFSASFGEAALLKLRKHTQAKFVLAFDNDEHGLGASKAEAVAQAVASVEIRIPSERGDYNDMYVAHGLAKVKEEIIKSKFNFASFAISNYVGEPPERDWLVENFIENKAGVFSSIGGVGKSMLALDLALKVRDGFGDFMGKPIKKSGSVAVFAAEDDKLEIHRRLKALNALDATGATKASSNEVYVITIPNLKQPINLLVEDSSGLRISNEGYELLEQLESINNLALCIFDPISSFVSGVPITTSQEAAQMYGQYCSMLSSKFNSSVISIHHMTKSALQGIDDPLIARQSVKGSVAILDSARFGLAAWLASESEAERICLEQGVEFDRMRVIKAAIVKTNSGEVDTKIKTLFRKNALLEIIEENNGAINWD